MRLYDSSGGDQQSGEWRGESPCYEDVTIDPLPPFHNIHYTCHKLGNPGTFQTVLTQREQGENIL